MPKTAGYAAHAAGARLEPVSIDRRDPGPGDVVIDVKYCGICHSDIHQVRDEWGGARFPIVPGHEIAGVVAAVGAGVSKFRAGDAVGVGCFVDSCRRCAHCTAGDEQFCDEGTVFTYGSTDRDGSTTMGGYSARIVVQQDYVLRMPANLPLDACAPLLCAGITLYSPLRRYGAGPGKAVAIVGLGGLGHMGVKLGHAMGAEVTVLSQSNSKEADARRLGADHYHATSDPATFEALAGRFDLVINTVSAPIDWNRYLGLLKVDGAMVVVGVPDQDVPVGAMSLVMRRRTLAGSLIGGIAETQEMLDFCGEHGVTCDIELIPMDYVNEAYDRVVGSDVRYRFVIDMASLPAAD